MLFRFEWGPQKFEAIASACAIRTLPFAQTGEVREWLHCKAVQTAEIKPDGSAGMLTLLIPASYITHVEVGPTFRIAESKPTLDLCIFPPIHPDPPNRISLGQLADMIVKLVDASIN